MAKIGRRVNGQKYRNKRETIDSKDTPISIPAPPSTTPLLKENDLKRSGRIPLAKVAPTDQPVPKPLFEKIVTIDGDEYRVQGKTVLELKENERFLRRQVEDSRQPTLNRYFLDWIDHRMKTANKPATPYRYRQFYNNHMRDGIGRKRLDVIKRKDVLELQAHMLEKTSPGTANYTIQLLKLILSDAVAEEKLQKNPAEGVKRLKEPRSTASETNHRALTLKEQKAFMDAARQTFYYEFLAFLLLTGLRQGEASALCWRDINWEGNVIRVGGTLSYDNEGHIITGPPKSRAGEREIPMNEGIRTILKSQEEKLREKFNKRALWDDRYVFPSSTGGVLHNATINKVIERILQKMREEGQEIEHFSAHALRDTFATRFIEQGGTPQTLKALLGHTSLKMTMDLYAHVLPNTKQKEMDMVKIEV